VSEKCRISFIVKETFFVAKMKNLSRGDGSGCNFEGGDRFTHYFLSMPAPYELFRAPKILGLATGAD